MKDKTLVPFALLIVMTVLTGCNAGVAPAGASQDEMRATFDKQPIDDRAKMLLDAPGPTEPKVPKIREMYQKEGKTIPPDIEKRLGGSGVAH